jgi:hypothetical protein
MRPTKKNPLGVTAADVRRAKILIGRTVFRELAEEYGETAVTVAVILKDTADLLELPLRVHPGEGSLMDSSNHH